MNPCGVLLLKTVGFYCVTCVLFKWFISPPLNFPLLCAAVLCHGQDGCCAVPCLGAVCPPAPLCQPPGHVALGDSALTGLMRSQLRWPDVRRSPEIQKPWLRPTDIMSVCNSSFSLAVALLHHATAWGCKSVEQPAKSVIFVDSGNSQKALLQVLVSDSLFILCSPLPDRRDPAAGFALHPADHKAEDL